MLSPMNYSFPYPSSFIKDVFGNIRNVKELFWERFGLEHYIGESTDPADYNCDGYHKYLTLTPLNKDPEHDEIYCKKYNDSLFVFIKDENKIILSNFYITDIQVEYNFPITTSALSQTIQVDLSTTTGLEEGICWNLTGNPIKGEGSGLLPEDTDIYLRAYCVLPDNTIIYSREEKHIKIVPDGYDYHPGENQWNPDYRGFSIVQISVTYDTAFALGYNPDWILEVGRSVVDNKFYDLNHAIRFITDAVVFYDSKMKISGTSYYQYYYYYHTRVRKKKLKVVYL